jgi:phosphoenolpyruvate carboxylase
MEIRIVIFLAFASVTVVTNTLVILFAYKAFASLTAKVTETMTEFQNSAETRRWIDALQVAAENAVVITESVKRQVGDFDPVLDRAQENYRRTLGTIDSKLEEAADKINRSAQTMRDTVAKPAFSVMSFASGLTRLLQEKE